MEAINDLFEREDTPNCLVLNDAVILEDSLWGDDFSETTQPAYFDDRITIHGMIYVNVIPVDAIAVFYDATEYETVIAVLK